MELPKEESEERPKDLWKKIKDIDLTKYQVKAVHHIVDN